MMPVVFEPGIIQGRFIGEAEIAQVRGLIAENGQWSRCRLWLIHDFWKPYRKYDALCNQHLLRELKFIFNQCGENWADQLGRFLLDWKSDPRAQDGLGGAVFDQAHRKSLTEPAEGSPSVGHPRPYH